MGQLGGCPGGCPSLNEPIPHRAIRSGAAVTSFARSLTRWRLRPFHKFLDLG